MTCVRAAINGAAEIARRRIVSRAFTKKGSRRTIPLRQQQSPAPDSSPKDFTSSCGPNR
jgi:hypothetical protein